MSVNLATGSPTTPLTEAASSPAHGYSVHSGIADQLDAGSGQASFQMTWEQLVERAQSTPTGGTNSQSSATPPANAEEASVETAAGSKPNVTAFASELQLISRAEGTLLGSMSGPSVSNRVPLISSFSAQASLHPAVLAELGAEATHQTPSPSSPATGDGRAAKNGKGATSAASTWPPLAGNDPWSAAATVAQVDQAVSLVGQHPVQSVQASTQFSPNEEKLRSAAERSFSPSTAPVSETLFADQPGASTRSSNLPGSESQQHTAQAAEPGDTDRHSTEAATPARVSEVGDNLAQIAPNAVAADRTSPAAEFLNGVPAPDAPPHAPVGSSSATIAAGDPAPSASAATPSVPGTTDSTKSQKTPSSSIRSSAPLPGQVHANSEDSGAKGTESPQAHFDIVSHEPAGASIQPAGVTSSVASVSTPLAPHSVAGVSSPSQSGTAGNTDVFRSLDAGSGLPSGTWIHAGPHQAEAGYLDPVLGWVVVRADASNGAVHASLVPSSLQSAQFLSSHLDGLNSYLSERQNQSTPITLNGFDSGSMASGSGSHQQEQSGAAGRQGSATPESAGSDAAPPRRQAAQAADLCSRAGYAASAGGLISVMA
jgi:hypothetical protein